MASKSRKYEPISPGSHGYGSATSTPTPGIERPKTPTMKSRIEEKNALIGLNNRLANILQRKQELEDENSLLGKELVAERENTIKTLTRLQTTYDTELDNLRKLLEDSEKDRAKLGMNYDKKANEVQMLQNKLAQLKAQIEKLTSDLMKSHDDRDKLARDNSDLLDENARLIQELEEMRNGLERAAMQKIELQSHIKGNAEEFAVKTQIFEQEIENFKKHREIEINEMDNRLQKKYESMLENDIQALRDEFDRQAQASREAMENLYNAKEADLKNQIKRLKDTITSKGDELSAVQSKLESITQKLSQLEGERVSYQQMIRDLQKKIQDDEEAYARDRARLEGENEDLRRQKENLIKEYQDLWDTKTALDNEIATYHVLLEGEERRLSMEPVKGSPRQTTTTRRETTASSSIKSSFTVV
ncbi:lamin Dm0 isoform X2 [Folsomia candida]|uniref:Lamin Dm0 n=1 Tax=Folsomia candida TaxID=158441 RepID=A0A226EHL3_FOLCA|nr:lamin Dm0 isoform X2 [Folsomia candida]OXA57183.1 Lamin Dm0 [Folsomia candida]